MTIFDFADLLDGRQYREEITRREEQTAKENGFVVIYGASDDLCEIAGAVHDEIDCFDGGEFYLTRRNHNEWTIRHLHQMSLKLYNALWSRLFLTAGIRFRC